MISSNPILTDAGMDLLTRATAGETLTFTRFKIGNGETEDGRTLTDLVNPLYEFGIDDVDDSNTGRVVITGAFDNSIILADMRWTELGLFAEGEDGVEVLYAYCNDGDDAGLLKAGGGAIVTTQVINLNVIVGTAPHVTAILAPSAVYASKDVVDAHLADTSNPHGVTAAQVGLGNVPNVSTNNQTPTYSEAGSLTALTSGETMSTAFGKLKKAVSSLISHIGNTSNPHSVTRAQIGAAAASHTHNADDINAGVLSVARGGTGQSSMDDYLDVIIPEIYKERNYSHAAPGGDLNNLLIPGVYFIDCAIWTNTPQGYEMGVVFVIDRADITGYLVQLYFEISGYIDHGFVARYRSGQNWTNWA